MEIKLEEIPEMEKTNLYLIKNEKGQYLCKAKPYWTSDINKCHLSLARYKGTVSKAEFLLKCRKEYDEGKSKCCNFPMFYGFERLFIEEVKLVEVNND